MTRAEAIANVNKEVTVWNGRDLLYELAVIIEYRADDNACEVELVRDGRELVLTLNNLHLAAPDELSVDLVSDVSVETVELPDDFDKIDSDDFDSTTWDGFSMDIEEDEVDAD